MVDTQQSGGTSKWLIYAGIGLVVVAIFALFMTQSSSSGGGSDTQAIQAIVASNVNAQNQGANEAAAYLSSFTSVANNVVNANAQVKLNAQNNATSLSENNTNSTIALDEAQLTAAASQNIASITSTTAQNIATITGNSNVQLAQIGAATQQQADYLNANTNQFDTNAASSTAINIANANAGAAEQISSNNMWGGIANSVIGGISKFLGGFNIGGTGNVGTTTGNYNPVLAPVGGFSQTTGAFPGIS